MSVSYFLAANPRYPAGTVLSVYKSPGDPGRQPPGAAVTTATMTASGVSVTGLEPDTAYIAGAVVGGRWVGTGLRTDDLHGLDPADVGANVGDELGQILLTTNAGQAYLRFGTGGTDESDQTGMWLEDGVIRSNTVFAFDGGVIAELVQFGLAASPGMVLSESAGNLDVGGGVQASGGFGVNGVGAVAKPTVSGSRGGNAALASLLTALANYGLVTNGSS